MKALFLAMCRTGSGSIKEAIKKSGSDEISFVDGSALGLWNQGWRPGRGFSSQKIRESPDGDKLWEASFRRIVSGDCNDTTYFSKLLNHPDHDEIWKKIIKFTVVRNPWDRGVSLWKHDLFRIPHTNSEAGFKMFCRSLKDLLPNSGVSSWHAQPIFPHISDDSGNLKIDVLLRFENLQEDFDKLCDSIGSERLHLSHQGKSIRNEHPGYRGYYTQETQGLIREAYELDINNFGYKF